ncbi:MAG: VOC family protein [Planctomycetia bacterium]|nr:VOC family protein [Planctomycetia bacterium]
MESPASLPLQEAVSVTLPIHHRPTLFSVELRTSRWTDMVEWYRHVLGLRVLVRVMDDGYALFEAGDTRVAILSRDSAGEASSRWSLGFEVVDLDAAHLRLREAGTELVEPKTHPEGFRELVTADPDGNRIRLFAWPTGH